MTSNLASLQADFLRPTILVVEDDFLVRIWVADEFRRQGFTVFEAPDTNRARDLLQSETIDLLFTDIQLSNSKDGVDGLVLARFVRATRPEIKVIIASARAQTEGAPTIADECFDKPYDLVLVVRAVRKLLADGSAPEKWRTSPACEKAVSIGAAIPPSPSAGRGRLC